jgi:tetratricopeptide (TPR) repeat protein
LDTRKIIVTNVLNLGAQLVQTGKADDAIAWAVYAGERYPDPGLQELLHSAAGDKLVKLLRANKISEARSTLTALHSKLSDADYSEFDSMIVDAEATDRVRNPGDALAALAYLSEIGHRLSPQRLNEMRTKVIIDEANRLTKTTKNSLEAIKWLESAIEKYGANPKVEDALKVFRKNRISELHNAFASLFNKRDYAGAKEAILKALQEFPGDQQLKKDLDMVEKALQ